MSVRHVLFVLTFLSFAPLLRAQDLAGLTRDYTAAKGKVKGAPRERAEKANTELLPVAAKIAKLNSDESLAFLLREVREQDKALPEIAAVCAQALAGDGSEKTMQVILAEYPRLGPAARAGVLVGLQRTKASLPPHEAEVLQAARLAREPQVKQQVPGALGKLDTPAGAQLLFSLIEASKRGAGGEAAVEFRGAVLAAIKGTKNDAVKKWLAEEAFAAAGSDHVKLAAAASIAGALKLEAARGKLEDLVGHASEDVSVEAVAALGSIGVGSSAPAIAKALEKGHGKKNAAFTIQALDAVAAAGTEEGLELVLRYAKSEDAALRAVAMGSLGRLLVGEALQALIAGLDDSESNVRSAALRTLARKRDKSIIGPLIAFLGKEKEDRLRVDALQLLVGLTGQNMGLVAEDWSKWWEIAADKFEFPKEGGEKKFTDVKAYDLTYFGIEVASKRLGFLVDASGSMTETVAVRTRRPGEKEPEDDKEPSGKTAVGKDGDGKAGGGKDGGDVPVKDGRAKKIDILKKELTRLLKKLPPETQINILSFDADFEAWQKELQPLAGQGRARAVQFVQGLGTGSGTNVFDTLEAALKDKRVDTVYLLTDGLPTRGRLVEPSAILREIAAQNRVRGITIHCIAFGEESPFLKDLAEQNGGQYRFVDSY